VSAATSGRPGLLGLVFSSLPSIHRDRASASAGGPEVVRARRNRGSARWSAGAAISRRSLAAARGYVTRLPVPASRDTLGALPV